MKNETYNHIKKEILTTKIENLHMWFLKIVPWKL